MRQMQRRKPAGGKHKRQWRTRDDKQAADKRTIYNSREWMELKTAKLRSQPMCERCQERGFEVLAQCVHHRHPIEESSSLGEMKRWAFDWDNLQSLCFRCHGEVHRQLGSHTTEAIKRRQELSHERWVEQMQQRFGAAAPQPAVPEPVEGQEGQEGCDNST